MLSHAQRAGLHLGQDGLRLNAADRELFRSHASVDDKLYDSRAGLGAFYRWKMRDIEKLCRAHAVPIKVHLTVLERLAHGTDDYSPGNIPSTAQVVITESVCTNRAQELQHEHMSELLRMRAARTQEVLRSIAPRRLLDEARGTMLLGHLSYYLYLATLIVAVVTGFQLAFAETGGIANLGGWLTLIASVAEHPVSALAGVGPAVLKLPTGVLISAAGLLLAYLLSLWVDARLNAIFSSLWYAKQKELRASLKSARVEVRANSERV
jgi:hypothetical protein